jgi:hypothetical protein
MAWTTTRRKEKHDPTKITSSTFWHLHTWPAGALFITLRQAGAVSQCEWIRRKSRRNPVHTPIIPQRTTAPDYGITDSQPDAERAQPVPTATISDTLGASGPDGQQTP